MSIDMSNLAIWGAAGAALGWLAYALISANAHWPALLNILAGAAGACAAGIGSRLTSGIAWHPPAGACAAIGALLAVGALTVAGLRAAAHQRDYKPRILLH